MSLEKWKNVLESSLGLTRDLDLLVEHLKTSGKLLSDQLGHVEVVKLVDPTSSRSKEISQAEKAQYDIHRTTELLEGDLNDLYEKQEKAEKLARLALREGKRNVVSFSNKYMSIIRIYIYIYILRFFTAIGNWPIQYY